MSMENEMSKALGEGIAANGFENNTTVLIHETSGNILGTIFTPNKKTNNFNSETIPEVNRQMVRNPFDSAGTSDRQRTVYKENISDYSNRKYSYISIFPVLQNKDANFQENKIFPRSTKPISKVVLNGQSNDDVKDHDAKAEAGKTTHILHPSYYLPAKKRQSGGTEGEYSNFDDEDFSDYMSSLEEDENELFVESNELFTHDELSKSFFDTKDSRTNENNQRNREQRYEKKQSTSREKMHKGINANEGSRVTNHRQISHLQLASEGEEVDYDENLSSEISGISPLKSLNKNVVCHCQKNGNIRTQNEHLDSNNKAAISISGLGGKGKSNAQTVASARALFQLLQNIAAIQSQNSTDMNYQNSNNGNLLVFQSSGVGPVLTSRNLNFDDLSILRQLGAIQNENARNSGNTRSRNPFLNPRDLLLSFLKSENSSPLQSLSVNANNAANLAVTQNSIARDSSQILQDLDNGDAMLLVLNSGKIAPLEGLSQIRNPGSQNSNIVGLVVNQRLGTVVPVLISPQNSPNANSMSGLNSGTNLIQSIAQNLNTPSAVTQLSQNFNSLSTPSQSINAENLLVNQNSSPIQSTTQVSNDGNVLVSFNSATGGISQSIQNTDRGGTTSTQQTGILLSNLPGSQNSNSPSFVITQTAANGGISQNLNNAGIAAVIQSGSPISTQTRPQNSNLPNVIVSQNSLTGGLFPTVSQNINNIGNVSPVQITQNANIPLTVNTGGVSQQTSNVSPAQIISQNSNNENNLVAQNSLVGSLNNAGSIAIQQTGNPLPTRVPSQNANANTQVNQNIRPLSLANQTGSNSVTLQNTPQNVNDANILVSQNNSGVGNTAVFQSGNNAVVSQQVGNSGITQSVQQNPNNPNVLTNQNNGGVGNTAIQQTNNMGAVVISQPSNNSIPNSFQNGNSANVLVNQNNGVVENPSISLNGINIGTFVPQQSGNTIENANIVISQNNPVGNPSVSINGNNVGTIVSQQMGNGTSPSVPQNSNNANILINQNTAGPSSSGPQNNNNGGVVLTSQSGNAVTVQTTSQNSNTAGAIAMQQVVGNTASAQNIPQNVINANVQVTQNSGSGGLQTGNLGTVITQQRENSVVAQAASQNLNNANIVVGQNVGNGSPLLVNSQNLNNVGIVAGNSGTILSGVQNFNNGNNVISQNEANLVLLISTLLQNLGNRVGTELGANRLLNQSSLGSNENLGNILTTFLREIEQRGNGLSLGSNENLRNILTTFLREIEQRGNGLSSQTSLRSNENLRNILTTILREIEQRGNGLSGQTFLGSNENLRNILTTILREIEQQDNGLSGQALVVSNANIRDILTTLLRETQQRGNGLLGRTSLGSNENVRNILTAILRGTQSGYGLTGPTSLGSNEYVGNILTAILRGTQGGTGLLNQTSLENNANVHNILTNLRSTANARTPTNEQSINGIVTQGPLDDGLVGNLISNNLLSVGVNSPSLDSSDIGLNQLSRNSRLGQSRSANLIQSLVNGNRINLVGNLESGQPGQRIVLDSLNPQQLDSLKSLQSDQLTNGLVVLSTSGSPEFRIIPDVSSPNGKKCDCGSKFSSDVVELADKDNIVIVVPTTNEQVYKKVLNTVTGSNNQPFVKDVSELTPFTTSENCHIYNNGISYRTKPHIHEFEDDYLERSSPSFKTDFPSRTMVESGKKYGKTSFLAERNFLDNVYERDWKELKSSSTSLPIKFSDKTLEYFGEMPRMHPQTYGIHKSDTHSEWHPHINNFAHTIKPKLYKYEPKITHS